MTQTEFSDVSTRERLIEAAHVCVGRFGITKTTIEDVAREAKLSRATIYRYFPGGKDELAREVVAWEMGRFYRNLAEAIDSAADFPSMIAEALIFANRAAGEHELLQKLIVIEPERILPLLTYQSAYVLQLSRRLIDGPLEREHHAGRVRPGVDLDQAGDYIARMVLSFVTARGNSDLHDPALVSNIVRYQILGGVLTDEALGRQGAVNASSLTLGA